jgi:hypothetical protein
MRVSDGAIPTAWSLGSTAALNRSCASRLSQTLMKIMPSPSSAARWTVPPAGGSSRSPVRSTSAS